MLVSRHCSLTHSRSWLDCSRISLLKSSSVIPLTIGEPQHPPPETVLSLLQEHTGLIASYPATAGRQELRAAIAKWLEHRFSLSAVDPEQQILPLNGTREGLFALAQVAVTYGKPGAVISPNPFYQIYEGAALLAGTRAAVGELQREQWLSSRF